jgi:hypothetical protein
MALNLHRLPLREVKDGGEVLFGVGGGDGLHGMILPKNAHYV